LIANCKLIFTIRNCVPGVRATIGLPTRGRRCRIEAVRGALNMQEPPPSATIPPGAITGYDQARNHIERYHRTGGAGSMHRSTFDRGVDLRQLLSAAEQQAGSLDPEFGTYHRTVEAEYEIGWDYFAQARTRTYTVVTTASNRLVTMFPGPP
jgi:hypothetical protein